MSWFQLKSPCYSTFPIFPSFLLREFFIYQISWSRWIIEGEKFTLTEDVIICLFFLLLLDNLSTSRGSFIMLIAWPAFIGIERVVGYLYSSCDKGRLLLAHKKKQFALYIRRIVNRIEFSQHREIRELHWTSITSIESFPLPFSFFFQGRKTPDWWQPLSSSQLARIYTKIYRL